MSQIKTINKINNNVVLGHALKMKLNFVIVFSSQNLSI